jgi:DNA-binding transcriptional ArsR family regulator
MSDEAVWKALSHPVRREMLDLLRDGPRTTGDLAARFGGLSRFAVMQHLRVLEGAELVLVRRQGKQRWNHLNAVPIQEIHARWVSNFAGQNASALLALREHVEMATPQRSGGAKEGSMDAVGRKIVLESQIRLQASPERVWKAYADEQMDWYPYNYGGKRLKAIIVEPRVGGRVYEDWGDDAGIMYSTVVFWDPPRAMSTRGFLTPAITLEQWLVLEAVDDGTLLKHTTTAFGPITDEMAEGIQTHGTLSLFEDRLRAWVERGERVPA